MGVIFDESVVASLVTTWQETEDSQRKAELWAQIVTECNACLLAIIRSYKWPLETVGTHEEIRDELILRLHKLLGCFKSNKGRFYSFLVRCSLNFLCTLRDRAWRYTSRHTVTDFSSWEAHPALVSQPEVYSLQSEIRERLEHFTRPQEDFTHFLVRNLLVYAHTQVGTGRGDCPTPERIAIVVGQICRLSPQDAHAQTTKALELLRHELRNLGGGHFGSSVAAAGAPCGGIPFPVEPAQ